MQKFFGGGGGKKTPSPAPGGGSGGGKGQANYDEMDDEDLDKMLGDQDLENDPDLMVRKDHFHNPSYLQIVKKMDME